MSKLLCLALIIVSLATLAIAEPNQPENTVVQQGSNSVLAAEKQQGKTFDDKEPATDQLPIEDEIKQADISLVKEQLITKLHENRADDLKWALGIIVFAFIAFIGYMIIKREKEYNEILKEINGALTEARDAGKEARASADKARDWEDKAKEKFNQIDEKVNEKLQLIVDTSQKQIKKQDKKISEEAEKQREISYLWSEGLRAITAKDFELATEKFEKIVKIKPNNHSAYSNWGLALVDLAKCTQDKGHVEKLLGQAIEKCQKAIEIKPNDYIAYNNLSLALIELAEFTQDKEVVEKLLGQAIEKCQKAIEIKPNYHIAYSNWSIALSDLAKCTKDKRDVEKLLGQAIEKCQKATEIKPDFNETYNNWGTFLTSLARHKTGAQREALFEESEEKLLKAESIKQGSASYNMSCMYALKGDKDKCKEWLEKSAQYGRLPTREVAEDDDDLKSVKDEEWFKQLRWK